MLSDLDFNNLAVDVPVLEEDALNFDDLLDIAHEFEFARSITHLWSCEEPGTHLPTGLDDILAAIVPTPNTEGHLLPLLGSTVDLVHHRDVDSHSPVSDPNASVPLEPVPLMNDDSQLRAKAQHASTATLQGWSPPNGSPSLDLDDNIMFPLPTSDMWTPWLTTLFPSSHTPFVDCTSLLVSEIGPVKEPTSPPVTTIRRTCNNSGKGDVLDIAPQPQVQPPPRDTPEPVRLRSTLRASPNLPNRTPRVAYAKTPNTRPFPLPSFAVGSTAICAKAPRGGIPPHIARTVTKANILRAEKERKVMRDAFSTTTTSEGKKPSVLERVAKADLRDASKIGYGGGREKKPLACDENVEREARVTKRKRAGTSR